jgi:hypothetical protein
MNSQKIDSGLEKITRNAFEYNMDSPKSWLHTAWTLKRAAEEIDTFNLPGRGFSNGTPKGRDTELLLLTNVYRFLMGQSFENLLKGIIITHGTPAGSKGKINKLFKSHDINVLLKKLDYTKCSLTKEEEEILKEQQQFVKWAGRYPISTKVEDYTIAHGYSSKKNRKELELWERLSEHIKEVGWANKCGTRVYKKSNKQAP